MQFTVAYEQPLVIQALRYHFISRREVKFLIILVNLFALLSAILYYKQLVRPQYFFLGTILWLAIMVSFWFVLPIWVYKRSTMFTEKYIATCTADALHFESEKGSASWQWSQFQYYIRSPHFFHLYFSEKNFLLIPRLTSEPLASELQGFIADKIKLQ
ncbi:MAG: YcxB family protein [Bacteroidetes bacterium]|nr:MAG: YcxB family protein [Bacteroidota bacterium]